MFLVALVIDVLESVSCLQLDNCINEIMFIP